MRPRAAKSQATVLLVSGPGAEGDGLALVLETEGHAVLRSDGGENAIAILTNHPVDLVLLDEPTRGDSGLQTLRAVRGRVSADILPLIVVTDAEDRKTVRAALRSGANDFVTRPVEPEILQARITTQLARAHATRALEESQQTLELVLTGSNDGFWDWNLLTDEISFSDRWKEIVGLPPGAEIGAPADWLSRVHPDDLDALKTEIRLHVEGVNLRIQFEHRIIHANGSYRWVTVRATALRDETGRAQRIAGTLTDITEHKATDLVTSLPNKTLLADRIRYARDRAIREPETSFALLVIRVRGFEHLTDSIGPRQAQRILKQIANRLVGITRTSDTLAILDGASFAILAHAMAGDEDSMRIVERIRGVFAERVVTEDTAFHVECDIGIAFLDSAEEEGEINLLQNAESAARQAARNERDHFAIFDPEVQKQVVRKWRIEQSVRAGLEKNQFFLNYQPVIDSISGKVRAVEALLRWRDDNGHMISPADFIPVVEGTRLILPLGEWALRQAVTETEALIESGVLDPSVQLNVNVSPRQLRTDDFPRMVASVLDGSALRPEQLVLEITEDIFIDDLDETNRRLEAITASGVECALDDFGTGFSSLKYLNALPISELKIDRSFIQAMDSDDGAIVDAIITMAHGLRMAVVAEGAEDEGQVAHLRRLGCDMIQGFYFAKPADKDSLAETIKRMPKIKGVGRRAKTAAA